MFLVQSTKMLRAIRKFIKGSYTIETEKTPDQIKQIIARNTQKSPSFFEVHLFKPKHNFFAEFGDNYINLSAIHMLLHWPFIELEMREHIEPRLKVKFQGMLLFTFLYIIVFLPLLFLLFDSPSNIDDSIGRFLYIILVFFIPYYAYRVQMKSKQWLIDLLS